MDLITIDSVDYTPQAIVEKYNSLIWTERYIDSGEFQLVTTDVDNIRNVLPEWQLVSLLETDQVMRVEDHEIGEDAEGNETLTVTGRAVETIAFEGRYVNESSDSQGPAPIGRDCVGLDSVFFYWLYAMQGIWGTDGVLGSSLLNDNIKPTDSSFYGHGDVINSFWKQGDVYTPVHDLLTQMNLGVRSIRPRNYDNTLESVFWAPGDPTTNVVPFVRTTEHNPTFMAFDFYDGNDLSSTGSDSVTFDVLNGAVQAAKYLISRKNFYTGVTVYEEGGPLYYTRYVPGWDPAADGAIGLNYRMKAVSGGSRGSLTGPQMTTYLHQLANIEIMKSMNTMSVDFSIQDTPSTPVFGRDYGLGDLVNLKFKYGIEKQGRVTEFIRSKDANGVKMYPTVVVTDPT